MTKAELIASLVDISDGAEVIGNVDDRFFDITDVDGPIPDRHDIEYGVLNLTVIRKQPKFL
jgi:hypothetical protein